MTIVSAKHEHDDKIFDQEQTSTQIDMNLFSCKECFIKIPRCQVIYLSTNSKANWQFLLSRIDCVILGC